MKSRLTFWQSRKMSSGFVIQLGWGLQMANNQRHL
jgi:hypothetical protein